MYGPLRCVTHIVFLKGNQTEKKSYYTWVIGAYCCTLKSTNFNMHVILAKVTEMAGTLTTKAQFIGGNFNQA